MSKPSTRSTPSAPSGAMPHPKESKDSPKPKEAKSATKATREPSPGTKQVNGSAKYDSNARTDRNGSADAKDPKSTHRKDPKLSAKDAKESAPKDSKDPKENKDAHKPKDNKGPRRFRGDVEPFNPSGAYNPQMYPPQGPYPLQPFYHQQPQFVYGNQMLPYYPVMGYPDLMYQQYQFYAMNQFTPPYNQMNVNGYAPRKKHGKYHPQGQHQSQSSAQYWLPHDHPHPYPDSEFPSHLNPLSPHAPLVEPKADIHNTGVEPLAPPAPETPSSLPEPHLVPHPEPGPDQLLESAQHPPDNASLPSALDPAPCSPKLQAADLATSSPHAAPAVVSHLPAQQNPIPENGRLLINITEDELLKERETSLDHLRRLWESKSACANNLIKQNEGDFLVNHNAGYQLKNHNSGSDSYQRIFSSTLHGADSNNNDSYDSTSPLQKPNLNWASFLQTTKKAIKPTTTVVKSALASEPAPESSTVVGSKSSLKLPEMEPNYYPQPLGLLVMKALFDPTFDLKCSNLFNVKPRGLTNSGNICYMNAVLQCLILCEPFNKLLRFVEENSIGTLGNDSPNPLIDATISFLSDFSKIPSPSKPNASVINSDGIVIGKPLSPEKLYMKLIENPKFKHLKWGQQEDAEEFLSYLLDGLHEEFVKAEASVSPEELEKLFVKYSISLDSLLAEELKTRMKNTARLVRSTKSKHVEDTEEEHDNSGWSEVGSGKKVTKKRVMEVEPSPITSIFGGSFRSVLTVPKAKEAQSITIDPYRCILLDISDINTETIEDALIRFTEVEKIPYKVEGGKEVIARKQSFIETLPEILILQLKRFSFEAQQSAESADKTEAEPENSNAHQIGTIEKVMKSVKFNLDLTVPPECLSSGVRNTESPYYSLVGVIYHHGRNAEGGHYTCDVLRSQIENKWLRVDDTAVESITSDMVTGKPASRDKSAYILMYQRA